MNIHETMERRQSARIRADFPIVAYQDGVAHHQRAVDLSCGGALIQRGTQRPPPMIQRVELHLGAGQMLCGMARTVWASNGMCAVRFVDMSDADRLDIAEHIDRFQGRRSRH